MSNRIREVRKREGLTMKQLGDLVGVAESTISHYEKGRREPDFETLLKISEALDVTVGYLLGAEVEKTVTVRDETTENRIRKFRKEHGMTMKELGQQVGVAENTISQYETGKRQPDSETLINISTALGVTVGALLGAEKEEVAPAGDDLFTEEEIQLLIKFRNTDEVRKAAIKALLESQ